MKTVKRTRIDQSEMDTPETTERSVLERRMKCESCGRLIIEHRGIKIGTHFYCDWDCFDKCSKWKMVELYAIKFNTDEGD